MALMECKRARHCDRKDLVFMANDERKDSFLNGIRTIKTIVKILNKTKDHLARQFVSQDSGT